MSSSLSADQRKALVRHYLETVWSFQGEDETGDVPQSHALQECSRSEDATVPPAPRCIFLGDQGVSIPHEQIQKMVRRTFPDIRLTITELVGEDEIVVARWIMQGTDLGGYEGHLPTGRPMLLTGMTMVRFEQNIMTEEWNEIDLVGMLRQLGFVYGPQPPRISMRRPGSGGC